MRAPVALPASASLAANARKGAESTVYRSERMTTRSLTKCLGSGGKARACTSFARVDSGFPVVSPCPVRPSPRNAATAAPASTTAAIHAATVRQG